MLCASCLAFVLVCAYGIAVPEPAILHAPLTAFDANGTVVLDTIEGQAARAAKFGVNLVFVNGGTAHFSELSLDERKSTAERWIPAAAANNLYSVVNIGTTVHAEAAALAAHASKHGANAIATVPPFYHRTSNVVHLVAWMKGIAQSASGTPLWYYHIPGATGVDIKILDLLQAAQAGGLTELLNGGGVKYVSTDMDDFISSSLWIKNTPGVHMKILFAPEPKLASFALQNPYHGTVLAEDFYAPTYLRMRAAYEHQDIDTALKEQQWKMHKAEPIFQKYGDASKRVIYRKLAGLEMGPPRLPDVPFNESLYDALVAELDAIGFWNQDPPASSTKGAARAFAQQV